MPLSSASDNSQNDRRRARKQFSSIVKIGGADVSARRRRAFSARRKSIHCSIADAANALASAEGKMCAKADTDGGGLSAKKNKGVKADSADSASKSGRESGGRVCRQATTAVSNINADSAVAQSSRGACAQCANRAAQCKAAAAAKKTPRRHAAA